jgi:hypothetical protein
MNWKSLAAILVLLRSKRNPAIRTYDGWCVWSAVRFECAMVGLTESAMKNIPLYIPPDETANSPYGIAGTDCPYPVLGTGSGLKPLWEFDGTVSPIDAVITLVSGGS